LKIGEEARDPMYMNAKFMLASPGRRCDGRRWPVGTFVEMVRDRFGGCCVLMVVATLLHPSRETATTIVASESRLVAAHVVYTLA
jgi:hypothetical protein